MEVNMIFIFLCGLSIWLKSKNKLATLNLLLRSVLLGEETGIPAENHRPVESHWQTLSHDVISSTPHHKRFRTHNVSGDLKFVSQILTMYYLVFPILHTYTGAVVIVW
jgi:hypothetical protein